MDSIHISQLLQYFNLWADVSNFNKHIDIIMMMGLDINEEFLESLLFCKKWAAHYVVFKDFLTFSLCSIQ